MATQYEIDRVFDTLRMRANMTSHPFTWTRELEGVVRRKLGILEYRALLDPIYEKVKVRQRRPDLTLTVVTAEGYPAFFSNGGPARSVRFNPNNHKHVAGWANELRQVWATRW